jgi:hypothetical protein
MSVRTLIFPLFLVALAFSSAAQAAASGDDDFARALISSARAPEISADEDLYEGLLGVWDVEIRDRAEDGSFRNTQGEWFFARTLEGRAVQDVLIAPRHRHAGGARAGNRYGTSTRTFDPKIRRWQVTWLNPVSGAYDVLFGRRAHGSIIQEGKRPNGQDIRWVFTEITPTAFRWKGEALQTDGSWLVEVEFPGRRRG